MDYIDFTTFNKSSDTTNDALSLSLPIPANIENLSKRFSNLNNLTRILKGDSQASGTREGDEANNENALAEKYAKMSLSILESKDDPTAMEGSSSGVSTTSEQHTNLNVRLARVLNESLSDASIREIFTYLQEKVIGENDSELIEPGLIGSMNRKKLRGKVESELIRNSSYVLKEYAPLVRQLKAIETRLNQLNELNRTTNEKIVKNYEFSTEFNSKVSELNQEKQLVGLQKNLLIVFKEKFTLNEYEEFVLSQGELNEEFFVTLKKAESINENCSILLAIDNPQLGVKIMTKINHIINKSRERIVSYTNKTLNNLYSLNLKSRLITLHKCFQYLKRQMNYFDEIINTFSESRSKLLIEEFYNQIQGDLDQQQQQQRQQQQQQSEVNSQKQRSISNADSSRPIFINAHDPVRFVGDLLAYVHSVAVNESETIKNIFTFEEEHEEHVRQEFESIIAEITDRILKSLSRPIKTRIESLISSETKLSTIYQIFNLVELYSFMFSKQLGNTGNFLDTIQELVTMSRERIMIIITNRLATVRTSNVARLELNLDLQPPEWIIDFYSDILPIIDQITTPTIMNFSEEDNIKFMKSIINEPIEIFNLHLSTNHLFHDQKEDLLIIRLNFLDLILGKIMPISLLSEKVLEVNDMIHELTIELKQYELEELLKQCNLYNYYNITNMICPLEQNNDEMFDVVVYEPIKENQLYTSEEMAKVNDLVQSVVPNALIEIQSNLMKLNSPITVEEVINTSFTEFVHFYKRFNDINNEFLQYSFTWTEYELNTLLGLDK
ncbi:oligomeric Golgi complex subunit 6 [Spathaspora passalidarum NRRL Y-27907]|uniref:Conserved oligomeric Golgi complex subunit 6 n=1 Tax=Spathaspora passalidarum (strain NRRL Y-27907 / 11-Y1) TaxID=619300 RepID=G3AM15_SPAPN|nr:oligomeric Golgi complex subunit 6 [Spathaspora passalidarum NRRL Y-27907]EGW33368.1 oligomeric Golgi complex subunit 6 [Spathaspora passalidarum NRRL Y-27907]